MSFEQIKDAVVTFVLDNKWYLIGGLSTLVVLSILF